MGAYWGWNAAKSLDLGFGQNVGIARCLIRSRKSLQSSTTRLNDKFFSMVRSGRGLPGLRCFDRPVVCDTKNSSRLMQGSGDLERCYCLRPCEMAVTLYDLPQLNDLADTPVLLSMLEMSILNTSCHTKLLPRFRFAIYSPAMLLR